jgi:hypothetical protein
VRLLVDIKRVFEERGTDRIPTADLIEALCEDETASWGDWHGRRITAQALARLLKPFGVAPTQWREGDRTGIRGYSREAFLDAWARYLPGPPPSPTASEPLQPLQLSQDAGFSHFEEPLQRGSVAVVENGGNADRTRVVADVAVSSPLGGEGAGDGELPTPEDLARGGGWGQFLLRVGEALSWQPYPYAPGRAIAGGKAAWIAFVRRASDADLKAAVAAMLADPALNRGHDDG